MIVTQAASWDARAAAVPPRVMSVGIGGLGSIGMVLARALDQDPGDFRLERVAARDRPDAAARLSDFNHPPRIVSLAELSGCEVVVEALPAGDFTSIAVPAIEAGCVLIAASTGALIRHPELIRRARETGARIIAPTGALGGLDAVRALALDRIDRVVIETRKPPSSLAGAPYLKDRGIDLHGLAAPLRVFAGNALQAVEGFPANANVAAALALAGVGPERTEVEIWADPAMSCNRHTIHVEAAAGRLTLIAESPASEANPRTSRLAPLSILAALRGLNATLKAGS